MGVLRMNMFEVFSKILNPALPEGADYVSIDEAKSRMENGGFGMMVDVRSAEEWGKGRIPGAIHAPLPGLQDSAAGLKKKWSGGDILLYCRTHQRSSRAAWILSEHGFRNIKVMRGGAEQWSMSGLPLER